MYFIANGNQRVLEYFPSLTDLKAKKSNWILVLLSERTLVVKGFALWIIQLLLSFNLFGQSTVNIRSQMDSTNIRGHTLMLTLDTINGHIERRGDNISRYRTIFLRRLMKPDSLFLGLGNQLGYKSRDYFSSGMTKSINLKNEIYLGSINRRKAATDSLNLFRYASLGQGYKYTALKSIDANPWHSFEGQTLSFLREPHPDMTDPLNKVTIPKLPSGSIIPSGSNLTIPNTNISSGELSSAKAKSEIYKEQFDNIDSIALEKSKSALDGLETKATSLDDVKVFQKNVQKVETTKNALEQYNSMMGNIKSEKPSAEDLKNQASTALKDQFATQESKLKAGIAELDKLKRKYKTIPDSRYLPKHVPNELKGKPFRNRIVPGLNMQVYQTNDVFIDVSPYVGYKLSGRFRPGVSATFRGGVSSKSSSFAYEQVYGFRLMNELKVFESFFLHTEGEWLHFESVALAKFKLPTELTREPWEFKFNVGVFKTYPISRRFGGQVQLLYNILDVRTFPQARATAMRFGFEYKIKPKKAK